MRIPEEKRCRYCGAGIFFVPGVKTPVESGWTGYTRHPEDGDCGDILFTSEGGRIFCRILPPEEDGKIEGWAHRLHLCRSRTTRREPTDREKAREEYREFRAEQAAEG